MPCQAAWKQPPLNFDSVFFLSLSFAFLIPPLPPTHTSLFTCFFSSVVPWKKDPLLLVQNPLQIFCYPRFVVREDSDMFRTYHRVNTQWNVGGNDISYFVKTGTHLIKHIPVNAVKTPLLIGNTVLRPVLHGLHHAMHVLNDRLVHRGQKHTVVVGWSKGR